MVSSQQDNTPNNLTGFIDNSGDRNENISGVFVTIGGVLKQLDLADSFYNTINGKTLEAKKTSLVTALEAIS